MAALSLSYTAVTGDTITAARWNTMGTEITASVNSISNAQIASDAAIAYSKLSLTGAILNADLAGSIAATKITNTAATLTDTQTLTNKRITKRVQSEASSATPTPDSDSYDMYQLTALAAAAAFAAPTGTPTNGQGLIIRIKDNATARALSWNAIYRAIGVDLPTTTTISKTMYLGFLYNSADTKWDCVAVLEEA